MRRKIEPLLGGLLHHHSCSLPSSGATHCPMWSCSVQLDSLCIYPPIDVGQWDIRRCDISKILKYACEVGLALLGFLSLLETNISQGIIWGRPRLSLKLAGKSNRIHPRRARTQPTGRFMSMKINAHYWMTLSWGGRAFVTYHYCGNSWLSHPSSILDASQLLLWIWM